MDGNHTKQAFPVAFGLTDHISTRFPLRLLSGFTLVMSAALTILWIAGRIIPYTITGRFPDELAGMTTLQTQAFDNMQIPVCYDIVY